MYYEGAGTIAREIGPVRARQPIDTQRKKKVTRYGKYAVPAHDFEWAVESLSALSAVLHWATLLLRPYMTQGLHFQAFCLSTHAPGLCIRPYAAISGLLLPPAGTLCNNMSFCIQSLLIILRCGLVKFMVCIVLFVFENKMYRWSMYSAASSIDRDQ